MPDATMSTAVRTLREAAALEASGAVREAIDLLSGANREERVASVEVELVRLRRAAGVARLEHTVPDARRAAVMADGSAGGLFEIDGRDLSVAALEAGLAQSGCVLVRGLVPSERVARLVAGIDSALAACDEASAGGTPDPGWYTPGSMPDRVEGGLSEEVNRRFLRERGGLWTADSPRMLFELFEAIDAVGVGALMTEFLGERPLLSANKCTLRRVPSDLEVKGGWHQDGSFLGDYVGAFNVWLSLSRCGRDAPGLDIVPRRVDRVVPSDEESRFDWSLSDAAVLASAEGTPIVRPEFEAGDALLFDHLLVHQTATAPEMTRPRHAIESWFFTPSAYPVGQIPILY
ncbi:MAG: phytanoyl-CoA dioxygenase family protein [Acidimicrobiales bacterium]